MLNQFNDNNQPGSLQSWIKLTLFWAIYSLVGFAIGVVAFYWMSQPFWSELDANGEPVAHVHAGGL